MINAIDIGNKISIEREKLGISQTELSQLVYVTPQAISKWENGQSIPSIEVLAMLTKLFGVSVDDLLFPVSSELEALFKQHSREYVVELVLSGKIDFEFEEHLHLFSNEERLIIVKHYIVNKKDIDVSSFWHLLSIYERVYVYDRLDGYEKEKLMLTMSEKKLLRRRER